MFQVPSAIAAKFRAAVKRTEGEEAEGGGQVEAGRGGPVEAERGPRRANGAAPVRHNPRPTLRPGGPNKRPQR